MQGKTFKTFYVNMDYGSNWLLFRGPQLNDTAKPKEPRNEIEEGFDAPAVKPYLTSTDKYSLITTDNENIERLMDWSRNYLQNNSIYE